MLPAAPRRMVGWGDAMYACICRAIPEAAVRRAGPVLGGAVQRNRVRRRLRELVREQLRERQATMGAGWDLLLIARPDAAKASHAELREALRSLVERSGIGG